MPLGAPPKAEAPPTVSPTVRRQPRRLTLTLTLTQIYYDQD